MRVFSAELVRVSLCLGAGVLLLAALARYAYHAIIFGGQLARIAAGAIP